MLSQHVRPHLVCIALLHCHLELIEHPVSHEVIAREKLLGSRVVARVVQNVDRWLAIHHNSDGSRHSFGSYYFQLRMSQVAGVRTTLYSH